MTKIIPTKNCNKCGTEKEISQFHTNKACSLGVAGTCKACRLIQIKEYSRANAEARRNTVNRRNKEKKAEAVEAFGNKCLDCQQSYPQYVYQFHHLDPTIKDLHPSAALAKTSERMWKELSKCVMLCANCHMIRHHGVYQ